MNLRLILLHCRMQVLQHVRAPSYIVPALLFPAMFFLYFGVSEVQNGLEANIAFASYSIYAFMGVAFYLFAGGVAEGRRGAWDSYLRTLPASYSYTMSGWALSGLVFGLLAVLLVTIVAVLTTEVGAPPLYWLSLAVALVSGSVPMALMAAAIGYWVTPKAALQIATLVYFTLAYAAGIWTSPESLPTWLQAVSPFLPSRLWGEIAWASVQGQAWQTVHWLGLAAYATLFGMLAVYGYRRENCRRYA